MEDHNCENHDTEEIDHSLSVIIYPYTDPVHDSPALNFPVIRKTMVDGKILKFGRKVNKENTTDDYFITFQSKVVSRNHAEIWYKDGQLYFRDIGSSSGTFLNKLRLSPSGKESRPYPLRSGDVIQLGIDYHGKKEDIYRCIMMKIIIQGKEANVKRAANIARLNNAIKELIAAASPNIKDEDKLSSVECCICLNTLAPYQALFLAPCTHCFHYKCVHPLLGGGIMFLCPLCRQVANLEATVSTDNLFEMGEDLVINSKTSLNNIAKKSESKKSIKEDVKEEEKVEIVSNEETEEKEVIEKVEIEKEEKPNKSTESLNEQEKEISNNSLKDEKRKNSIPSQLDEEYKSSIEDINSIPEGQELKINTSRQKYDINMSPSSASPFSYDECSSSSPSKKKELPSPNKKMNRKGTFKTLITTFRRKRSNSTHAGSVSENRVNLNNKNVKSTGNIVNDPNGSLEGHSKPRINKMVDDDTGNVEPIDDDPVTANPMNNNSGFMKNKSGHSNGFS